MGFHGSGMVTYREAMGAVFLEGYARSPVLDWNRIGLANHVLSIVELFFSSCPCVDLDNGWHELCLSRLSWPWELGLVCLSRLSAFVSGRSPTYASTPTDGQGSTVWIGSYWWQHR